MLMGPRPTLGFLGYLALNGSWRRLGCLLLGMALVTVVVMQKGRSTITLTFSQPLPFPPPMMLVQSPHPAYTTPLDACSVEAAGVRADQVGGVGARGGDQGVGGGNGHLDVGVEDEEVTLGVGKQVGRQVHVFGWRVSVGEGDTWGYWVARLPRVHMALLDLPRVVGGTPLKNLARVRGEEWRVWAAARVALLWAAGGVVLPMGLVATQPVWVESVGPGSGILLSGRGRESLDPALLGTPALHPLVAALAESLDNDHSANNLTELLTKVVKKECQVADIWSLPDSDCDGFSVLQPSAVLDIGAVKIPESREKQSAAVLLRYSGNPEDLLHLPTARGLFRRHQLQRYCPLTAAHLEDLYRVSL